MTFFYFVSCGAVTFAPCLFLWRLTPLADSPFVYRFLTISAIYLFTQFSKFLLIATFFPEIDPHTQSLSFPLEFFKSTMYLFDLIGIEIALLYFSHKFDYKVLTVGASWATCQALASKLLPLWFGGRSYQFSWDIIVMAFRSNMELVLLMSTAYLVFLFIHSKREVKYPPKPILLMLAITYFPLMVSYLSVARSVSQMLVIAVEIVFTTIVALATYILYGNFVVRD